MLGRVIFWVLIIAIYAADSLTMGSVSLTILYSCWLSEVSSKEKALHLQQPRRLRHRLLWVRVHRIGHVRLVLGPVFFQRSFLPRSRQRRRSARSSPGPQLVDEETRSGQPGLPGFPRERRQRDVPYQEGGPAVVEADGAGNADQEGRRPWWESHHDCRTPDQILLGGSLPLSSLPRISIKKAELHRPLLNWLRDGLLPVPVPVPDELPGAGEDRVGAGKLVCKDGVSRPPGRLGGRCHPHLDPQLLHPGREHLPLQGVQQCIHSPEQLPPALRHHPPPAQVLPMHRLPQEVQQEGQHDGSPARSARMGSDHFEQQQQSFDSLPKLHHEPDHPSDDLPPALPCIFTTSTPPANYCQLKSLL